MKLKINNLLVILFICLLPSVYAQHKVAESNALQDWVYLNHMKNFFCKAPEECEQVDHSNMLENLRYVDKLYTNRSKLAEAFLDKYPNDPHYDEVLSLFLSSYFTPTFIPENIASDKAEAISNLPRKGNPRAWSQAYRLLPVDKESKKRWLNKGNELVNKILASNTPVTRKAKVEIWLFNRDYGLASKNYAYLPRDPKEQDYWASFEADYWESMRLRLETLMETYPDSEPLAKYIQAVLDDIRGFSPELSKIYTDRFFKKSGNGNPLANHPGIKALHKLLSDNLEALEALKFNADDKPLEMAFTALDGTQIDLTDMRGKVVLIDFWSTSCPPCIAAMPQLKVLYDKYQDKGFEIIGIAANGDSDKEQILKLLKKVNATWPQRLDKGKEASVSFHSLYEISVLPTVWLLDTSGKVVERDVKVPQLESLIRKYLRLEN